jgi:tRNA G46 methylase TrmB
MAESISRSVTSNQSGPHESLNKVVSKHLLTTNQKPFQQHTLNAFESVQEWLADWSGPIVLDSCCGVGESSAVLAKQHPDAKVIGIDKSAIRVNKHAEHYDLGTDNHLVVRADVIDFWRLVAQSNWSVSHHYILYPNPYPKSSQFKRRWHGSAAFADLVKIGGHIEVRSNWQIYIEEFSLALGLANISNRWERYEVTKSITPFERKYTASQQACWRLLTIDK